MAVFAKKSRFQPGAPDVMTSRATERRRDSDRRDPTRVGVYAGIERRRGPRRTAELPRPLRSRPIALVLAIALGVATGLAIGSTHRSDPMAAPRVEAQVDAELLVGVQALRDEAEALTPAGVALDEEAHERWMPRVAAIELALADPQIPTQIRTELDATLDALERVGVLRP